MPKLVDGLTLEQWSALEVWDVLEKLGCYAKWDASFVPIKAWSTLLFDVNDSGAECELLVTGPKFWDTCRVKGGSGTVDLITMHLLRLDLKNADQFLHRALSSASVRPSVNAEYAARKALPLKGQR